MRDIGGAAQRQGERFEPLRLVVDEEDVKIGR
jgi:hypothetical protein